MAAHMSTSENVCCYSASQISWSFIFWIFPITKICLGIQCLYKELGHVAEHRKGCCKFRLLMSLSLTPLKGLLWAALRAARKEMKRLLAPAALFLSDDTGLRFSHSWDVVGELVECAAVLAQCWAVRVTLHGLLLAARRNRHLVYLMEELEVPSCLCRMLT